MIHILSRRARSKQYVCINGAEGADMMLKFSRVYCSKYKYCLISELPAQVNAIRDSSLARVLCENGDDIQLMQPLVFKAPTDMWVLIIFTQVNCRISRFDDERQKYPAELHWLGNAVSRDDQLCNLDCCVTLMHTTLMGMGELIGDHHTPKDMCRGSLKTLKVFLLPFYVPKINAFLVMTSLLAGTQKLAAAANLSRG